MFLELSWLRTSFIVCSEGGFCIPCAIFLAWDMPLSGFYERLRYHPLKCRSINQPCCGNMLLTGKNFQPWRIPGSLSKHHLKRGVTYSCLIAKPVIIAVCNLSTRASYTRCSHHQLLVSHALENWDKANSGQQVYTTHFRPISLSTDVVTVSPGVPSDPVIKRSNLLFPSKL